MDLVKVENMARTAQLEHHVVGNIDQCCHAALTATRQPINHPRWRAGLRIDVANNAARETATQIGGADLDGQGVLIAHYHCGKSRRLQRRTGQGRDFTGNAINTQAMRQIGR